jgi:transposase
MSDAVSTFITALLPLSYAVRLTEVTVEQEYVVLQLTATMPTAYGPCYGVPSSSVHRHDQRRLTDLPWGTCAVHIQLTVRKFVCRHLTCARRLM